jgi:uncharacterized membrane protein
MKKIPNSFYTMLYVPFALFILFFTSVMIGKILPYLSFQHAINFLGTKSDEVLGKSHFYYAFYLHILSSGFALLTGIFQFSTFLFKKKPSLHRLLGKIYVISILFLAAPSGLVISFYANGGLPTKIGFVMQSTTWLVLTFWAWEAVRAKKFQLHTNMMLRSYALTLAAMSLRTESYLMVYFFQTKPIETYNSVVWMSWVGNLLFVEVLLYYGLGKRLFRDFSATT